MITPIPPMRLREQTILRLGLYYRHSSYMNNWCLSTRIGRSGHIQGWLHRYMSSIRYWYSTNTEGDDEW